MSRKSVVKNRMKELGISEMQIAHYCALNVKMLNLWLDAKAIIPYSSLLRIAHLLDLEPNDLYEYGKTPKR